MELHGRLGDVFRIHVTRDPADTYVLADPDLAQEVLASRHADFERVILDGRMSLILGNGLLTSSGAHWKRQRKRLQPAFHGAGLQRLQSRIARCGEPLLRRWERHAATGAPLELTAAMLEVSLAYNLSTLFGADADAMGAAIGTEFLGRLTAPIRADTRSNLMFMKEVRAVRARIAALIGERWQRPDAADDLLGMFLRPSPGEATPMSEPEIVDEVIAMLTAGHETVATALKSAAYLLALHPDIQGSCRHEAQSCAAAGAGPGAAQGMPLTRAAVHEAMRLYPPIWVISRKARVATRIGPYDIPAGSTIFVCPYLIHRHPAHWPDPATFDPGRFADHTQAVRHNAAYLPYSRGARTCIGEHLSMCEMLHHFATVLPQFSMAHLDGHPRRFAAGFALRALDPIHVRVTRAA